MRRPPRIATISGPVLRSTWLGDGREVRLHLFGGDEDARVRAFLLAHSPDGRRLRGFAGTIDIEEALRPRSPDDPDGAATYATVDPDDAIAGHAVLRRLYGARGELAFELSDGVPPGAVASLFLAELERQALAKGLLRLRADLMGAGDELLMTIRAGRPTFEVLDGDRLRVEYLI